MRLVTLTLSAALLTGAASSALVAQAAPAAMAAAPARPQADIDRDASRKPKETIAFVGVKSGMSVAEMGPGGGYYTRLLAEAVGPTGKVYALVPAATASRPGGLDAMNAIVAAYPQVVIVPTTYPTITVPAPVDVVWTTENYHDYHNGPTANIPALNKAAFDALKPGGIYYVEDHSAATGAGLAATSAVHRMDEAIAKTELAAAGFRLDAEGSLLRNPADNKAGSNSESGHFVTDRFMLRMKKP